LVVSKPSFGQRGTGCAQPGARRQRAGVPLDRIGAQVESSTFASQAFL
jgi:hypothetical protein